MKERMHMVYKNSAVVGHVSIDYFDPVTERVKERIEGKNHIFKDSFMCSNWSNCLSSTTRATLFLMDDDTPANDNFPYLRGNILGWGQIKAGSSGDYQGGFVSAESAINQDVNEGRGRLFKYVYEFGTNQIPDRVKSLGITTQFRPLLTVPNSTTIATEINQFSLRSMRERKLSSWPTANPNIILNVPAVIRNNWRYSLYQAGTANTSQVVVTAFNLISGEMKSKDVTEYFSALGTSQSRAIGASFDSNRMYLMMYSATAANRRVYEFSDDTFETLLNTYSPTNLSAIATGNVFAVLNNKMYQANTGGLSVGDYINNITWATIVPLNSCPYNTAASSGNRFITIKDGVFWTHGMPGTAAGQYGIFDIANEKQLGSIAPFSGTTADTLGFVTDPALNDNMFLYVIRTGAWGTNHFDYVTNQALATYVVPSDTPKRPEGTGMKITYQIDVAF